MTLRSRAYGGRMDQWQRPRFDVTMTISATDDEDEPMSPMRMDDEDDEEEDRTLAL